MIKKIIGILICMLLIATAVFAVGYLKDSNYYSTFYKNIRDKSIE